MQDPKLILEQEYERFIEFGNLLDRATRKYLVQYLQNQLAPGTYAIPEINDQYFLYFKNALDRLFAVNDLLNICKRNEKITHQIILDTLYWLRKTYAKVRTRNPFQKETDLLAGWAITPVHVFLKRWPYLIEFLKTTYKKEVLDTGFYRSQFKALVTDLDPKAIPPEQKEKLDLILTDLLAQWDALLNAKLLEYQLTKLEEEKENFIGLIEAKVKEYTQLLSVISPFSDYLGWDLSRALWQESSFDIIQQYHHLLEDEASIKELADLLGSMREAEIELEEETYEKTIIRQEWVQDPSVKSEIIGVHESDDLNNMLSSEAGLLSQDETELLFLKKYADKNLMTFKYEDKKLVKSENYLMEVNQKVRLKEKGPFIICIDTSESMMGRPEQIAKVLSMGILKMAMREKRKAYLINFSIGIKTLDLYDIANTVNDLAKFLKMSFYGGTDISLALFEAFRKLRSNDYEDADVLVVSDFIMYRVNKDALKEVRYFQQNKSTQFHSLTLSSRPNEFILNHFDTNWVYNPKEKGIIKSLTQGLHTINNRL